MRGEGRCETTLYTLNIVTRLLGGDVLKDDLEFWKISSQRNQLTIDEDRFSVKHIHTGIGHLPVQQQQQAQLLHLLQNGINVLDVGDA
jgi:hypothetical protein